MTTVIINGDEFHRYYELTSLAFGSSGEAGWYTREELVEYFNDITMRWCTPDNFLDNFVLNEVYVRVGNSSDVKSLFAEAMKLSKPPTENE